MRVNIVARPELVTEMEWRVFSLTGSDVSTKEMAKLLHKRRKDIWYMRSQLHSKLGLAGTLLIVCAVKCVWVQQHAEDTPHIAEIFKRLYCAPEVAAPQSKS